MQVAIRKLQVAKCQSPNASRQMCQKSEKIIIFAPPEPDDRKDFRKVPNH
jgi:hypothetical protein